MRFLPFILLFALIVYALVDCVRYDDTSMPAGMPKALWVVLIVVFPAAGAIAWLVVSRVNAHATTGGSAPSPSRQPPLQPRRRPVTRQVAPDDDPEFLASLGRDTRAEEPTPPATGEQSATGTDESDPEPTGERDEDGIDSGDRDEDSGGRPGSPPAA